MNKSVLIVLVICMITMALTGCQVAANPSANSGDTSTQQPSSGSTTPDTANATAIVLDGTQPDTITKGGSYTVSGTLENGQLRIDTTEKITLQLDGVTINNPSGAALQVDNAKEITLVLKDGTVNTLTDGGSSSENATVFSNDTLIIEGQGQLILTAGQEHGIESDDDIIINSGTLTITAINDGLHANNNITVNGGQIDVLASVEGIESKGDVIINAGVINITSSDDCINATVDITINGGTINAKSQNGDAIDSNGTINLNGGDVVALGGNSPEGGIDCDNNGVIITGGTLLATGGSNSRPSTAASTQNSVMLAGTAASSVLRVEGDSGTVLEYTAPASYQSMLYTSPQLATGSTYTVYVDNAQSTTFTIESAFTASGGDMGMGGGRGGGGGRAPDGTMPEGMTPPNGTTPPSNAALPTTNGLSA